MEARTLVRYGPPAVENLIESNRTTMGWIGEADAGSRGLLQDPRPEANVLNKVLQPTHASLLATRLLDRLHPTELSHRRITSFLRLHPFLNVLLRLHLDVRTHLVIHLGVQFLLKE